MSQRDSGYARKERELYETPEWVTRALIPHIPERVKEVYEPAAGSGKMVRALGDAGYTVDADDISEGRDFLQYPKNISRQAIITNPPYLLATEFVDTALAVTCANGFVAMLLRTDFDHAKTRARLFSGKLFSKKLVLRRRIVWIERTDGKKAAPSYNHAWFMWDWKHDGPPILAYAH